MQTRIAFLGIALLLFANLSHAQIDIGNGFTCTGDSVFKGSREVNFRKARSNVQKTIAKLREKLDSAPPKRRAGIRAKIQAANNAKKLIRACSKGELSPDQVDPIFTQLSAGSGTFTGTYNGTVGILPISGPVTMQFILDGTSFSTLLTLGGNLGSALDAEPLSFTGPVGGIAFPAQFFIPGTFLGDVTLNVAQDGALTITNSNTTVGNVKFDGKFQSQSITATLGGVYKGIPFDGSMMLARTS